LFLKKKAKQDGRVGEGGKSRRGRTTITSTGRYHATRDGVK